MCAAPLAAPPGITREISLFFPMKYEKKGQMVKDQKIFGTGKLVSTDCIPLELGAVLNLERKVSATNETHKMVINAEALLTTQRLINECALQNSFPLFVRITQLFYRLFTCTQPGPTAVAAPPLPAGQAWPMAGSLLAPESSACPQQGPSNKGNKEAHSRRRLVFI